MMSQMYESTHKTRKRRCNEKLAPYIISPFNSYKIAWDNFISLATMVAFIVDPYIFAFNFEPLENEALFYAQSNLTWILTADLVLNFFTGIPKEDVFVDTK